MANRKFKLGHGLLGSFQIPLLILVGLVAILAIHERPLFYGMLVAALGEAIQVWSASHLHKDKNLASSGPYAYVRNPMYFGRFFVGLGITLMTHNPWVIGVYVAGFVLYVVMRVGGEEARLRKLLGQPYIDYCADVPRFFPRFTPYPKSSRARATWESFTRNHEYRNVIGLLVMFAILCVRIEYYGNITLTVIVRRLVRMLF